MPYRLIRPLVFRFDAERAHGLTIAALKMLPETGLRETSPRLRTSVAGLDFPSPVGLAAGFDKNAEVPDAMLRQGFGFVERSEEHTSELQSLMRISYAVFCLKKKKYKHKHERNETL